MANVTALDFLQAIFAHKPESHHILIWTLNRSANIKRNNFFTTPDAAAKYAGSVKTEGTDIYFCVGTLPKLKSGRGKIEDVLGIGSVHLDVDIVNAAAHKKQNLPATIDEAIDFVNQFDLKPSILVHSGYGLHAYWLLQDFMAFNDEADRVAGAGLIESWQKMFKWAASKSGYDVDATQDITRVLRVPDTMNWKVEGSPVQAKVILFDNTLRYTPEQLQGYLAKVRSENKVTVPLPAKSSQPASNGHTAPNLKPFNELDITLDENATIDADTFEALNDNVPKFKMTWQRKRKDLLDQSGSSYDMALANMALGAGIDDQTTVNLLIAHRRKHNDEKPRLDYYQRTLSEARSKMQVQREKAQAAAATADPDDKDAIRHQLKTLLGFEIVKIDKQLTEPPAYIMHFANGKAKNMGDAFGLIDQKTFKRHIANSINKVIKGMKADLWESAAQKMLDLAEDVEISDEATEIGEVRDILETYLGEHLLLNATEKQHRATAAHHQPAVIGGSVCIHALELWRYAKRNYGYKKTKGELIGILKRLEAERAVHNVRDDRDKQHCISVYSLPDEWLPANAVKIDASADDDFEYAGKI